MNAIASWISLEYENNVLKILGIPIDLQMIYGTIFKLISTVIIVFLMYITIKIGNSIIEKFIKNQTESNLTFTMNERKAATVGAVLKSLLKYVVYFVGILMIISRFFGNISLTFAGIGGAAIGFGAKDLVADLINGVFILFEDQYAVGDYVTVDKYTGVVDSIGIRTTVLKDFSGDYHLIPNGSIITVTNHSRGNMRVQIDIDIAYEEDIDRVTDTINEVCTEFSKDNKDIIDTPKVIGVVKLKDFSVTLRVLGSAKPMTQWSVERELRKNIKIALDKENIEIPYPKTELVRKR